MSLRSLLKSQEGMILCISPKAARPFLTIFLRLQQGSQGLSNTISYLNQSFKEKKLKQAF